MGIDRRRPPGAPTRDFRRTAKRLRDRAGVPWPAPAEPTCATCNDTGVVQVEGTPPGDVERFCPDCSSASQLTRDPSADA